MSNIYGVHIRTVDYLEHQNMIDAFRGIEDKTFNLYYQYNQLHNVNSRLPEEDMIGIVKNVRESDGSIVCDVVLDDMRNKSSNFMGIIDNYTLKCIKDNDDDSNVNYELVRFIVYDKEFKRKVDDKIVSDGSKQSGAEPKRKRSGRVRMHRNRRS